MTLLRLMYPTLILSLLLLGCKGENPNGDLPSISIADVIEVEGDDVSTFTFTVRMSQTSDVDVTMVYRTEEETATAGEDFEAITATPLTIPAGNTSAEIQVTVLGDEDDEADENFLVILSELDNASFTRFQATGTLRNDDVFTPVIDDAGYRSAESYDGYNLVWSDEFDGASLDQDTWTYEIGDGCPDLCGWGNAELQWYTDRAENARQDQGYLVIEARQEDIEGRSYSSARIKTESKETFQFGRIDIRAKMPEGAGMWPALWMLGQNISSVGWPACGEIDIMEMVGGQGRENTVHGTVHWDNDGSYANFGQGYTLASGDLADQFHVYTVIWDETAIRWFIDDIPYNTIDISGGALSEFQAPFFFIFNIAVGGTWPGSPDGSTVFPQQMVVDYVRVFQEN